MVEKIIIIGAGGQIGTELTTELRRLKGAENVVAGDIFEVCPDKLAGGPYVQLNALDRDSVRSYIIDNNIKQVYLLAALLSATAEKNPDFAWRLNMEGLFTILDLAKEGYVSKIFWPSSIAVFGPTTPEKIHRSTRLWNRLRYMEYRSRQVSVGVNIMRTSSMLTCVQFVIRD